MVADLFLAALAVQKGNVQARPGALALKRLRNVGLEMPDVPPQAEWVELAMKALGISEGELAEALRALKAGMPLGPGEDGFGA